MLKIFQIREASVLIILAFFILIVGIFNSTFTSIDTMTLILKSSMILVVLAIGQSFVIITGNIDVSVGSIMGLAAAICGTMLTSGYSAGIAVTAAVAAGAALGLINGIGVTKFNVPAIIMTLGTLGIIRGYMLIYTEGKWIEDIPNYFKKYSGAYFLELSTPIWIGMIALFLAHIFLMRSRYGRYFYAAGDNEAGARLIGLPVVRIKMLAFVFSGISGAIAACIFVMNIGFIPNGTGSGIELQVIAAAVLGGVSLSGGQGSLIGASLGAIFLEVINSSLVYLKIPAYWNNALFGALLLIIVMGDSRIKNWIANSGNHTKT